MVGDKSGRVSVSFFRLNFPKLLFMSGAKNTAASPKELLNASMHGNVYDSLTVTEFNFG